MKKYHIILVVLLSIFFMPNTAMACGSSNSAIKLSIDEIEKFSNPVKWVDVGKVIE